LRINVSSAAPLVRKWLGNVANETVLSETKISPIPMPWMMPVTTIIVMDVLVVKPIIT
jgi:hypothetical protein